MSAELSSIDDNPDVAVSSGPFEARYLTFLETITSLRGGLHRYCSRMTGSVMDGEDVVQDALFEAYRKLDQFDDSRPLSPWLFRIAHNRCIDFLRHRGVREKTETNSAIVDFTIPKEPASLGIRPALELLVLTLPPKERACVLLKDVIRLLAGRDRGTRGFDRRRREGCAESRPIETGHAPGRSCSGFRKNE